MKSRKGVQKSRSLKPDTYAKKLHEILVGFGWKAGSKLDVEHVGERNGNPHYRLVNLEPDSIVDPKQVTIDDGTQEEVGVEENPLQVASQETDTF